MLCIYKRNGCLPLWILSMLSKRVNTLRKHRLSLCSEPIIIAKRSLKDCYWHSFNKYGNLAISNADMWEIWHALANVPFPREQTQKFTFHWSVSKWAIQLTVQMKRSKCVYMFRCVPLKLAPKSVSKFWIWMETGSVNCLVPRIQHSNGFIHTLKIDFKA